MGQQSAAQQKPDQDSGAATVPAAGAQPAASRASAPAGNASLLEIVEADNRTPSTTYAERIEKVNHAAEYLRSQLTSTSEADLKDAITAVRQAQVEMIKDYKDKEASHAPMPTPDKDVSVSYELGKVAEVAVTKLPYQKDALITELMYMEPTVSRLKEQMMDQQDARSGLSKAAYDAGSQNLSDAGNQLEVDITRKLIKEGTPRDFRPTHDYGILIPTAVNSLVMEKGLEIIHEAAGHKSPSQSPNTKVDRLARIAGGSHS